MGEEMHCRIGHPHHSGIGDVLRLLDRVGDRDVPLVLLFLTFRDHLELDGIIGVCPANREIGEAGTRSNGQRAILVFQSAPP